MNLSMLRLPGLTVLVFLFVAPSTFPQGSLTPPDAPGPTMKALDQLEARTIVNATNTPGDKTNTFIISQPGSYYLTGNIIGESEKHGISIQADDVTLDLNGFALSSGGGGAVRGVDVLVAQKNLCLRNGTIRGWTDGGVRAELASNTLAEKLRLTDNMGADGLSLGNGSARDCVATGNGTGFILGNGAQIRDCAATANTIDGFVTGDSAQLTGCISTENTGVGFNCASFVTLSDCTASRNFGDAGIKVLGGSSVIHCNGSRNIPLGSGISTGDGSTVADCTANNNGVFGIGTGYSTVRSCTANANGSHGISAFACVVTGCTSNNNGGQGIVAIWSSITKCSASSNGQHGILGDSGVVALCQATLNQDPENISAQGSARTGNNPAP